MSKNPEPTEDGSLRYWKAVIATLPPSKRDAAWEFYMTRIGESRAGDTLSGLVLMLEANGGFMAALPGDFETRLVRPINETIDGLRSELQRFAAEHYAVRESTKQALSGVDRACHAIMHSASETAQKVQIAVQEISTEKIAKDIHSSLAESTLNALKSDLKELSAVSKQLEQSRGIAKHSVDLWNSIRIGGVVGCAAVFSVIFGAIFSCFVYSYLHGYYEKRLGEEVTSIREAYEQNYLRGIPPR